MKIKNVKVAFLEESILASGYPMQTEEPEDLEDTVENEDFDMYEAKSINRAKKLANTPVGSGHNNFLKGIIVQFDLQYPEYFSPQLQRYHWIDIVSSQSKMHKITSRELTKNDFTSNTLSYGIELINYLISEYNSDKKYPRIIYSNANERIEALSKDHLFNFIISNLPSGYLKWMRISTNYLQLKTIVNQRKNHKLQGWRDLCEWAKTLPSAEELIFNNGDSNKE